VKPLRKPVQVGDTFKKADATCWLWQVAEIFQPSGHCLHARLVRKNVAHDVRVFSLFALCDRRLFSPFDDQRSRERAAIRSAGSSTFGNVPPVPDIRIELMAPGPRNVTRRVLSLPPKERCQTDRS
jgi:hypothetical protein